MVDLESLLQSSAARHSHLCPRQVLGVRMGLAGAELLGIAVPARDKRLLVIAETDGCFLDGLQVATGVTPGGRTLRVEDFGKVAATFVDTFTGEALRLAPQPAVRTRAAGFAPAGSTHYDAQLIGYQVMPDGELFGAARVALNTPVSVLVGRPGLRVNCAVCGEEIMNGREVMLDGEPYCRTCAGAGYYRLSGNGLGIFSPLAGAPAGAPAPWVAAGEIR